MINRIIKKELISTRKSVLLLGPRQVGKSTLMGEIRADLVINLADELEFLNYSSKPEMLKEKIEENNAKFVFIDEIQRLPKLLNTIQVIIDKNKAIKFYLTGSSARKLKRGEANLLPGRMVNFYLGPLVAQELDFKMNTKKILGFGSLPEIYLSDDERENIRILKSYAANYIKEEVKAEALVRNLDSFTRFFQEVTRKVGSFVDYTKLASGAKISRHAIPRYFEILEDSLIGYRIFPFINDSHKVDLIKHPKFYFFDNGVYNGLLENFVPSQDRIGILSEQLVFNQIMHSAWACEKTAKIFTFRERSGIEVDFIIELEGNNFAVEVKTNENVSSDELEGLKFYEKNVSLKKHNLFVWHMGKNEIKRGNVWILPWQKGLQEIGL